MTGHRLLRGAIRPGDFHLDQFVRLQRALDLRDDFVGEPLVADDDDRAQRVGLRAQLAAAKINTASYP